MRAAVLLFAFDHLGASHARSAAFVDNSASLRVSEKLGYRRDGTEAVARRGRLTEDVRLLVGRDTFRRPDWTLEVEGSPSADTRLIKHWGKSKRILDDTGDVVRLESFRGITLDCLAYGNRSC